MLITADTVLTGRELLRPGWIDVSGESVTAVGSGEGPRPADRDLGAVTVMPGFVDTHLHGGGGANFSTAARDETATAVEFHRTHGTTTAGRVTGHRGTGGPAASGRRPGRRRACRITRRNSSGRSVAVDAAVRRPSAGVDAGSRFRRDRPRPRNGRGCSPDGHDRAGTRRRPCRDRADRRSGRGCRRRPHRSDVRTDQGGDRRGCDGGHPSVQRDASDQHQGAGAGHRLARRPKGDSGVDHRRRARRPGPVSTCLPQRGTGSGFLGDRCDGGGGNVRRQLLARSLGSHRRQRGRARCGNGHHRGQHSDHGSPVPVRRRALRVAAR